MIVASLAPSFLGGFFKWSASFGKHSSAPQDFKNGRRKLALSSDHFKACSKFSNRYYGSFPAEICSQFLVCCTFLTWVTPIKCLFTQLPLRKWVDHKPPKTLVPSQGCSSGSSDMYPRIFGLTSLHLYEATSPTALVLSWDLHFPF